MPQWCCLASSHASFNDEYNGMELLWGLKPNFRQIIMDMVKESAPNILIVTETRIGGDHDKEITDKMPFDGAIHTDTIGYAGGLWVL